MSTANNNLGWAYLGLFGFLSFALPFALHTCGPSFADQALRTRCLNACQGGEGCGRVPATPECVAACMPAPAESSDPVSTSPVP